MYQEFYANSSHLIWPLIGLFIFVTIFLGVLAYVFLGLRDRDKIDTIAALPLASDCGDEPAAPGRTAGLDHATGRAG